MFSTSSVDSTCADGDQAALTINQIAVVVCTLRTKRAYSVLRANTGRP